MLVLSGAIQSDLLYWVVLMFRVPGAAWLLNHGCFFALGIWLFMSANRKLTALERFAVAMAFLSGCAEILFFSSYLLKIPAISGQSALVPIAVWAAAVFLIAAAANRSRRSTGTVSPEAPAYLRTLGLITYPLYLTHNIVGSAIIRVLIDAGLDDSLAVWAGLGMLVLVCWLICAKIEPAIRRLLRKIPSNYAALSCGLRRLMPLQEGARAVDGARLQLRRLLPGEYRDLGIRAERGDIDRSYQWMHRDVVR
jgi:peptidoglycan/LPS O-acetylase OafA/YrhL